jgi:hypothetical protein
MDTGKVNQKELSLPPTRDGAHEMTAQFLTTLPSFIAANTAEATGGAIGNAQMKDSRPCLAMTHQEKPCSPMRTTSIQLAKRKHTSARVRCKARLARLNLYLGSRAYARAKDTEYLPKYCLGQIMKQFIAETMDELAHEAFNDMPCDEASRKAMDHEHLRG